MGYGDVHKQKYEELFKLFYDIITNINDWDNFDYNQKSLIIEKIINKPKNVFLLIILTNCYFL